MKKVIVTGANGFIGTSLLELMSKEDVLIFAIIKDESEDISKIKDYDNVKIIYCDFNYIEKLPNLITDRDIDYCIHLAWAGSFGDARADYDCQLNNVKATLDLIEVLKEMKVKRFVGAGTLAEKDVLNYHMTDGATPNAVSIYGIAKLTNQLMTKALCSKYGIEHIWCYLSNTYGVGNTTNNFVNMASRKMIRGERASFTSGEQTYDFVYITDTVKAINCVAKFGKKNCSYYLGSTKERPLKEYIKIIKDTVDPHIELYLGEVPFNGKALSCENYSAEKLVEHTGFVPSVDFEDGIKKTVEWLKEQEK
ncbi:MAG: NAD(P)-dependent oxidoreductase [Oscillospiraceae bacterium]|nr:NAD(P)-dependent oxidoreductase [Candidatus Ruminococcus equi]